APRPAQISTLSLHAALPISLLDILQSIPVLSFLPGLVLALVAIFPTRNIGLELATILMIFTGQVWNMTFSYYHSLKAVPQDQREDRKSTRLNSSHVSISYAV